MSKIGLVRIIVLRHTGEEKWRGLQLTQIIGMNAFQFGHICTDKPNNWLGEDWMEEEIDTHCRDDIDKMFKDKAPGFYELIGEFYHEGHTDYWGEYDSHAELRNTSIQLTTYDQARCFDYKDFLCDAEIPLIGDKSDTGYYPRRDVLVSPYMPKKEILLRQAKLLEDIIAEYSTRRTDFSKMTVEERSDICFMMGLEVQTMASKEGDYGRIKRDKLEQIVRVSEEILKDHKLWMEEELVLQTNPAT